MKEFDVTEQTDVTRELVFERRLTWKAFASLGLVAVIVPVRRRSLG